MDFGMDQHGEAGTGRMKLKSADETASIMLGMLLVLLNGAGISCPCRC